MLKYLNSFICVLVLLLIIYVCHNNKNAKSYFVKAIQEMESKNYNKAIVYLNESIELDSTYAEAFYIRCQALDLLGKDKALVCIDLKKAADLGFEKAKWAYTQYCDTMQIEEYEQLLTEFNGYIMKYPYKFEGYYDRGNLYFDNGLYEKAIEDYNKVLTITNYAVAYYNRGVCYLKLNQPEKACQDIRKAISLGYDQAKEALRFCN